MTSTMKRATGLLAVLAAAILALAMTVPAWAATINVTDVNTGETYEAFKILEYSSSDTDNDGKADAYSYYLETSNAKSATLKTLLERVGFEFDTSADGSQYVLKDTDMTAAQIVAGLKTAGLTQANALDYASKTAASDGDVVFSDLDTGYWFVTTTTGSLCSLASFDDEELVVEKHEDSTVTKDITESSTNVGDTVHFTVTVNAKERETVTLTDELGEGLTLDDQSTLSVKVNGEDYAQYGTITWTQTPNASTFTIPFNEVAADTTIVVTYTATVNSTALTKSEVENTATISWGQAQSVEAKDTSKLFNFDISKVDGEDNTKKLNGVEFTFTKDVDGTTYYYNGNDVWTTTETKLTTEKIGEDDGMISIDGIAAGEYVLTEVKTLDGYNLLASPLNVSIADDGTITVTGAVESSTNSGGIITVENNTGSVLPSTGGIGTTIFYVIGGILIAVAAIFLITRKRVANARKEDEEI